LFSKDTIFSLSSSLFYFRFGLFSLAVWFILENNRKAQKYFFYSLLSAFILIIIDGYIQFFYGKNILGYSYISGRLSSLFGDELIVGNYLSRLYPLLLGLIFFNFPNQKFYYFLVFILFILIDIIIYLSGERVAFLNLIISSVTIIILIDRWKKIRLITFAFSLIIIFLISISSEVVKNRMIDQTIDKIGLGNETQYLFSEEHQNFYVSAVKMFVDRPVIGNGPKMYRKICKEEKYFYVSDITRVNTCSTSPHGTYPQLLAEIGVIGTLPVFLIFLMNIYKFYSHFYTNSISHTKILSDYQICILSGILLTVWPIIPS
jgi:O-antigen ligase